MDMLQSQSTSGVCSISQAAAVTALESDTAGFLPGWVSTYRQRRDAALQLLNAIPGISCIAPGGSFYLYANCSGLIGKTTPQGKRLDSDLEVVLYFLEAGGVSLIAGTAYGLSPYFRMSITHNGDAGHRGKGQQGFDSHGNSQAKPKREGKALMPYCNRERRAQRIGLGERAKACASARRGVAQAGREISDLNVQAQALGLGPLLSKQAIINLLALCDVARGSVVRARGIADRPGVDCSA